MTRNTNKINSIIDNANRVACGMTPAVWEAHKAAYKAEVEAQEAARLAAATPEGEIDFLAMLGLEDPNAPAADADCEIDFLAMLAEC